MRRAAVMLTAIRAALSPTPSREMLNAVCETPERAEFEYQLALSRAAWAADATPGGA